jgi:prepilin-type N-terminal cleavage/methylation domain-containing protein
MSRAFSLVELSIVLVILGLLTGGILGGQALIRASELRAIPSEYHRFQTATHIFRDKYFAIPGDFNNAQAFWGQSTVCAGAAATGTCNGNGDGILNVAGSAATGITAEIFQFWRQLQLAGLLEGSFTGTTAEASADAVLGGTNTPFSKYAQGTWAAAYSATTPNATYTYTLPGGYQNYFMLGVHYSLNLPANRLLKPEDAWNIDTKLDDGKPGTGRMIVRFWNNGCATGGAATTDLDISTYYLANTGAQCALYFPRAF